jgi:CHASE2 domain-containing sensor protein
MTLRCLARFGWSLLAALAVLGLSRLDWAPWVSVASGLNDLNFKRQPLLPGDRVVFVDIDRAAERRFGRWPWDRATIADALAPLASAQIVALDMTFAAKTSDDKDLYLAETLAGLGNVVGGFFLRSDDVAPPEADIVDMLSLSALHRAEAGAAQFPASDGVEHDLPVIFQYVLHYGCFALVPDPDSVFRKYPLAVESNGLILPTLSVQALRHFLDSDLLLPDPEQPRHARLGERTMRFDRRGLMRLNFYPLSSYPRIPLVDLLDGKVPPSALAGRIVVLGISEAGVSDLVITPLGEIPGPLVHCTFIHNHLENHFLIESPWLEAGVIIGLALLVFAWSFIPRLMTRLLLYLLTCILLYWSNRLLFVEYRVFIDLLSPLVALVLAALTVEISVFQADESRLRRIGRAYLTGSGGAASGDDPDMVKRTQALLHRSADVMIIRAVWHTANCDGMRPRAAVSTVNRWMDACCRQLADCGGVIADVEPTACSIVFGLEQAFDLPQVLRTVSALHAAATTPPAEHTLKPEINPLTPAFCLTYGTAATGIFGSETIRRFGVAGAVTDRSHALAAFARTLGLPCILAEQAAIPDQLPPDLLVRWIPCPAPWPHLVGTSFVGEWLPDNSANRVLVAIFADIRAHLEQDDLTQATTLLNHCSSLYNDPMAGNLLRLIPPPIK